MDKRRKSRYKHIKPVRINGKQLLEVYRKDPKTKQTVYLQRHQTVQQCCTALRKRFPQEAASFSPTLLKLSRTKTRKRKNIEKIKYKGITPIVYPNGKKMWRVQKKFHVNSRNYDTQVAAARAVCKSEGITMEDLKHKKPRLPMLSRQKMRTIYAPAMALYRKRKPADLENLEKLAMKSETWKYLKQYPGILPSFLIAKVGADRENVMECCSIASSNSKKNKALLYNSGEEYAHYSILIAAAKRICRHRWSESEKLNVGKNNYHWMNFHTMLTRLGILSLVKPKGKGITSVLVFQNSGTQYYICPWSESIEMNMRNHIDWGRSCLSQAKKRPKNAEHFLSSSTTFDSKLDPLIGAQGKEGYCRLWLKRAWMLFCMKAYKRRINFDKVSVKKFIACWPDQHSLLLQLLSDEKLKVSENLNSPLSKALKKLNYNDKPELLSMHACLLHDHNAQSVLRSKDSKWITRNSENLKQRLLGWRRREGIWPHPGVFFPTCVDLD